MLKSYQSPRDESKKAIDKLSFGLQKRYGELVSLLARESLK